MTADSAVTTRVVLLGTGTPNADPLRSGPSVAVVVGDCAYLVDFGPGVVRRAAEAFASGIAALEPTRIELAFLTHLHSDHTAGYADLILTPWVLGRAEALQVFGPTGLLAMTQSVLKAYESDIHERLEGAEPALPTGYSVTVHEIETGPVYEDSRVRVEAVPARHGSWTAFGYRFTTADRNIVISGDTAPSQMIQEAARGCDLLVHEVYSTSGFARRTPAWRAYHAQVHTSAHELARIACQAQPGLLVLYHQLFWGVSEDELLREVRSGYAGRVVSGQDLGVY